MVSILSSEDELTALHVWNMYTVPWKTTSLPASAQTRQHCDVVGQVLASIVFCFSTRGSVSTVLNQNSHDSNLKQPKRRRAGHRECPPPPFIGHSKFTGNCMGWKVGDEITYPFLNSLFMLRLKLNLVTNRGHWWTYFHIVCKEKLLFFCLSLINVMMTKLLKKLQLITM